MVSHRSLSDNKSPQVFKNLLSILTDLNNAVVWVVSAGPVISKSWSPLVTVPRAPITIGIIVTFIFHSFFNSLVSSRYLSHFSNSFNFTLLSVGTSKSTILQILFFFSFVVDYYKMWSSGRDLMIRLYLKIPEELASLILQDRFWVVHIPFIRMVKFRLLAQFPVDHLTHPVVSSLKFFYVNLLHSLVMWLIVSSLSHHNQHLLFCCVLSILALIWLVLMALFCAVIRRDSVSLLRFPFLSHVHIFSFEMSLVSRLKRP